MYGGEIRRLWPGSVALPLLPPLCASAQPRVALPAALAASAAASAAAPAALTHAAVAAAVAAAAAPTIWQPINGYLRPCRAF